LNGLPTVYALVHKTEPHPLACAEALYWVPITALLNVQENETLGFHIILDEENEQVKKPISHLLWSLCVKKATVLQDLLKPLTPPSPLSDNEGE